jgi:DNA-binding MltR family transcriptional regulator
MDELNNVPRFQNTDRDRITEQFKKIDDKITGLSGDARLHLDEINSLRKQLLVETDRGLCLMAVGRIDLVLTTFLENKLVGSKTLKRDLFSNGGPLSTLSSRIKMAYSLGLISKAHFHGIDMLRMVRNKFAHSDQPITFESVEIMELCMNVELYSTQHERPSRAKFITTYLFLLSALMTELRESVPFIEKTEHITPGKVSILAETAKLIQNEVLRGSRDT